MPSLLEKRGAVEIFRPLLGAVKIQRGGGGVDSAGEGVWGDSAGEGGD